MKQSLYFPLVVETEKLHTELFVYNPFTHETRELAPHLASRAEPVIDYRLELLGRTGVVAATVERRALEPLGICRFWLGDLVKAPFAGSARIDCTLPDATFAPGARRYLQTRVNIYAGSQCIITDHGRQHASNDEEVIYGEMSLDTDTETAVFLTHAGARPDTARPVLHVIGGLGAERVQELPSLSPGMSAMMFLGDFFPDLRGDAIIRVTEKSRGLLTGYHFKLPKALRDVFNAFAEEPRP